MSDSPNQSRRHLPDVDISRPRSSHGMPSLMNGLWFLVFFVGLFLFYLLDAVGWRATWIFAVVVGFGILFVSIQIGWQWIVRRGMLTWMRLAWAPAKAMARGDAAGAERALHRALERCRRFAAHDHRRGLMLVELAGFVKNQGRYAEAKVLYKEGIEILAEHWRSQPTDYFIVLNNYAIYFIHLRDHAAAQQMLEKALDLTLVRKRGKLGNNTVVAGAVRQVELVLHLNLVYLFIEMAELDEAELHMEEAAAIFLGLPKRAQTRYGDHYRAIGALLLSALGRFADAGRELDKAANPSYPACLRVRAKLLLVRQEFSRAEQLLREYFDAERKKGPLHRPELRDHTLDLAESLFGQSRHDEALQALQEARAIVADFALPTGAAWRRSLGRWLQRAHDLGRADLAASLQEELQLAQVAPEQAITISDRLRVRPRGG